MSNEDNYDLHLANAAAIGVRLGKSTWEMVDEIKATVGGTMSEENATIDPHEISEENNQTNLLKAAAIGVQLGMSAEEIAGELENVADNFWQMRGERN
jgi:hypothetical protein